MFFIYASSIPNHHKEVEKGQVRATTITSMQIFEKIGFGIKYTGLMQSDFNLTGAAALGKAAAIKQIPSNFKTWTADFLRSFETVGASGNNTERNEKPAQGL